MLTIQSIHVYRLRLFQDIIAQSFTLFASLRFNRGENLWTIQAFPERLRYVPELEEQ